GVGGKTFYHKGLNDRDCEDHIFVTYEFPGRNYANDKNDVVVVTYSSISTNQFEPYGECVMGTRGTMVVEMEASVMLYPEKDGKYVQRLPRCHGEVAMADAIIALTANRSMKQRERIEFKEEWFKADSKEVPDSDTKPKVPVT